MAETNVPVSSGAGNNVDFFTLNAPANLRQAVVIGDSAVNGNVAPVQATDPTSNTQGLVVRDVNTSAIVSKLNTGITVNAGTGTFNVQLDPGHTLGIIDSINKTVNVILDPGHTLGIIDSVNKTVNVILDPGHTLGIIDSINKTVTVQFDPGHELGSIRGNTNTLTVFLPDTGHELGTIRGNTNTLTVFLPDTGHELGTIRGNTNTLTVFLPDTGHELGTIRGNTNTLTVFLPDTGHELGTIRGNTNTLSVWIPDTGHTIGFIQGTRTTLAVSLDPGYTLGKVDQGNTGSVGQAWFVNESRTASIFTTSGKVAGVSVSGNQIIAPSAAYNFKIFAFALSTTAQSNISVQFTNGAGTSPTEFWRYALQAPAQGVSGANLAVPPPSFLFATGVNVTLSLVIDSASLVHYSVSYVKESA